MTSAQTGTAAKDHGDRFWTKVLLAVGVTGALVSDEAASRLHPTGFDPAIAGDEL